MGENILLDFELIEKENWKMPINFKADKIKAISGEIGSRLDIKATGIWKNATIKCDLYDLLSYRNECCEHNKWQLILHLVKNVLLSH